MSHSCGLHLCVREACGVRVESRKNVKSCGRDGFLSTADTDASTAKPDAGTAMPELATAVSRA